MIRSILLFSSFISTACLGQSSVEALGGASDAGQQVYDGSRAVSPNIGKVYSPNKVDTRPEYPGDVNALKDHLLFAEGCGVLPRMEDCFGSSKVVVDLVVNADGTVGQPEFSKESCPVLHPVVICAMKGLEKWTPGMLNGEPVRVKERVTVKYDLR